MAKQNQYNLSTSNTTGVTDQQSGTTDPRILIRNACRAKVGSCSSEGKYLDCVQRKFNEWRQRNPSGTLTIFLAENNMAACRECSSECLKPSGGVDRYGGASRFINSLDDRV